MNQDDLNNWERIVWIETLDTWENTIRKRNATFTIEKLTYESNVSYRACCYLREQQLKAEDSRKTVPTRDEVESHFNILPDKITTGAPW